MRNCLPVCGDPSLPSILFIPLVHYCPGVRTCGSAPTHRLYPARSLFLSSCQSVCLFFPSSCSLPVPAGLADQEPGLPWQPVLSPLLDGSSLDRVSSFTTPQKCTPATHIAACGYRGQSPFSSLTLSPLFKKCNHTISPPLPAIAPNSPESARSGSLRHGCQLRQMK